MPQSNWPLTDDQAKATSTSPTALAAFLVVVRVILVIGGSLVVFLLTFIGYLTLPLIVLSLFLGLYALFEVVVRRPWRKKTRIG